MAQCPLAAPQPVSGPFKVIIKDDKRSNNKVVAKM